MGIVSDASSTIMGLAAEWWGNLSEGMKITIIVGIIALFIISLVLIKLVKYTAAIIVLIIAVGLGVYILISDHISYATWVSVFPHWDEYDTIKKLEVLASVGAFSLISLFALVKITKKTLFSKRLRYASNKSNIKECKKMGGVYDFKKDQCII